MMLIHTLLFFIRSDYYKEDLTLAEKCLKSLSKSSYKKIVIFNQGCITNEELKALLSQYDFEFYIIGTGKNEGIIVGRQSCFEYIWEHFPETNYISELHLDMFFTPCWEDSLVEYLQKNDEPVISCGIIDNWGQCANLDKTVETLPNLLEDWEPFLKGLRINKIVPGFAHPCIHNMQVLKEVGGYNQTLFKGKQCYEDDSLLLSYYYYYGTRANWYPKINYNCVVYHGCATQRIGLDRCSPNYTALIQQYGIMGQKHLSKLHSNIWQKDFFKKQFEFLSKVLDSGSQI